MAAQQGLGTYEHKLQHTLRRLVGGSGQTPDPNDVEKTASHPHAIAHLKLGHAIIPELEKLASVVHAGTFVCTARGADPPKVFEEMPLYVRLGMQILYHGKEQELLLGMSWVDNLLNEMTIKQGKAFDSTEDVLPHIQEFIKTYNIDTATLLHPELDYYKTFNSFFYRQLKPDQRPVSNPEDPTVISSAADCRLTVFESVDSAKKFWIKGHDFTIENLIDDAQLAQGFVNGEVAVFRLAPADYHRYHSPVNATVGPIKSVKGQYYTVNPVAVNENLNVFTKNRRDVTVLQVPFSSLGSSTTSGDSTFPVLFIQVGAMLVGSVCPTKKEGEEVKRGEELGYFAYGGSTCIAVFPPGKVQWDEDLLNNSEKALETLVKVGDHIGKFT